MSEQEDTSGADPARKSAFDLPERERIRAALFRYMEEHRVGVPTLIAHMAKAVKRDQRYIPQKTLQRFLAGEMRTNDASVAIFHEFVRALPPARDELAELSLTLGSFFKSASAPGGPPQSVPLPIGLFETHPGDAGGQGVLKLTLGNLTVAPRPPAQLRLMERLLPPVLERDARPPGEQGREGRGELFEGVATPYGALHIAILRSTATRRPRVHWLTRIEGGLQSFCQSAPLLHGGGVLSEQLHFLPRQDRSGLG